MPKGFRVGTVVLLVVVLIMGVVVVADVVVLMSMLRPEIKIRGGWSENAGNINTICDV